MGSMGFSSDDYRNECQRLAAWRAHYMAKGCSSTKADDVARRKIRSSHTWPPGVTPRA